MLSRSSTCMGAACSKSALSQRYLQYMLLLVEDIGIHDVLNHINVYGLSIKAQDRWRKQPAFRHSGNSGPTPSGRTCHALLKPSTQISACPSRILADASRLHRRPPFRPSFQFLLLLAPACREEMESLSDTSWDVVLSGTSLPQSLLAL